VSRLLAGFVAATLAVTLSLGVVSLAFAQTTTTDTTPDDTTTTTTPPDTTPTTTTTAPDQGVITPPSDSTTIPTEPGSTTPTTEPTTEPAPVLPPPPPPPDDTAPPKNNHDNDIYIGTVTTLSGVQRDAIEAFLAATDRLGRAQTALTTTTLNPPTPAPKPEVVRTPTHTSPSSLALIDSANALDRAIKRVAVRAHETLGIPTADSAADDAATAIKDAQDAVDAAQADVDHATGVLRSVANGDPLITTLLTGKPPAGDGLAQRIATAQNGQGNPPALEGIFALPIPGAPIVSPYGFRIDPIGGNVGFHPGIDIGATQGTPILAAAAGTVLSAGDEGGYGNAVILDHGNSLSTLYGHMVRVACTPGQHVEAGDVIGYVGSTGISTGPHLHFEVRVHGVTTDPLPTLKS